MEQQLVLGGDVLEEGYRAVYGALTELRETFHRSGRFDDSNAKLDEVGKLFATYLAYKRGRIPDFPGVGSAEVVSELQSAFERASDLPEYKLQDHTSIFGASPRLALRVGDDRLAEELATVTRRCIDLAFRARSFGSPFDALNEAFGHFIRDNFRSNIEDAQYMTPPEVVDFMADIALTDLSRSGRARVDEPLVVLDPTCGVGSFLAAVYNRSRNQGQVDARRLRLFGQDKVDRMVRLATLNLELFDVAEHRITAGNSLALESPIDSLNGQVDLILTNPPFGARFARSQIGSEFGLNTPFFASLRSLGASVDSELLFIDRNLRLLREGGRLLIVVPDGVISAKGTAAMLRHYIHGVARVRAIIALPAVTFAQAGTRTKTAILYLEKTSKPPYRGASVFMGIAQELGFQVASRKGVQVKLPSGGNDLLALRDVYNTATDKPVAGPRLLRDSPSAVLVPIESVVADTWTPDHYSARRFRSLVTLSQAAGFDLVQLSELVEFCSDARSPVSHRNGVFFISVLHVLGEGMVDMRAVRGYAPKTPGIPTFAGEILLSRINPRIPRVCIVPDFGAETLCSTEFEIMRPKSKLGAYAIAYLLQTRPVQEQIASLTSGTSASHNRIRTANLARVSIPMPREGSKEAQLMTRLTEEYREAITSLGHASLQLSQLREREREFF